MITVYYFLLSKLQLQLQIFNELLQLKCNDAFFNFAVKYNKTLDFHLKYRSIFFLFKTIFYKIKITFSYILVHMYKTMNNTMNKVKNSFDCLEQ